MTIAFDLRCGVSGDMILGALLDMYSRENDEVKVLDMIEKAASVMSKTSLRAEILKRNGIEGKNIFVQWDPLSFDSIHGNRMLEYLDDALKEINANDRIIKRSRRIFQNILDAEMVAHGCKSIEEVHLHETGTPDTLADIIGITLLFDKMELDGEWIKATPISLGGGTVETSHGVLQVPVPAVRHMIRNLPVRSGPVRGELATPTGVAAISALVELWMDHSEKGDDGEFSGMKLGSGAGKRVYEEFPNMLTIWEVD
jgi:hypothetical protein